MSSQEKSVSELMKSKSFIIFAHRGASGIAPENTIAAFILAKNIGVGGIELDVHLSASGDIVVIHDYQLNRTARMPSGALLKSLIDVESLTLDQLMCYDFGVWFSDEYAGEKIPTLKQAMDAIGPDMLLDIEIKADKGRPFKSLTSALANFLHDYSKNHSISNIIVSSFNPFALKYFAENMRQLEMNIPTGLLYGDLPKVPWYLKHGQGRFVHNPDFMIPYFTNLQSACCLSGAAQLNAKPFIAWTVDDTAIAKSLSDRNIAGIITNTPEKMLALKLHAPHCSR